MAIEAPINVTPDNETVYIDKTQEGGEYVNPLKCSFTFNGDNLSWWRCEHYDNVTGELIGHTVSPKTGIPWTGKYRNGDTVTITENIATDLYENGHDYKYRFILYQADSNNEPLCDMLCLTGRVVSGSGNTVYVEKDITDIDEPYSYNGVTIGYCMLEVVSGGYVDKIQILYYDKNTGKITLADELSAELSKGTRYKVYRSYYKTPCYFVRCREKAAVSPSLDINEATGALEAHATWTINSEDEVSLQKYKWTLEGIAEGAEIYSYHDKGAIPARNDSEEIIDAVFPYLADGLITATLTTTTQDGYVQECSAVNSSVVSEATTLFEGYSGNVVNTEGYRVTFINGLGAAMDLNRIRIRVIPGAGYDDFRLWKRINSEESYKYVCKCGTTQSGGVTYITASDHLIDDGTSYQYLLTAKRSGSFYKKEVGTIAGNYKNRTVISKLSRLTDMFGLRRYDIDDSFVFDFEQSEPTININDGQTVIETGGRPIMISESGQYLSGEFSAAISQLIVTGYAYKLGDGTEQYKQALDFFDDSEYLIKLPGRECIIGRIIGKSLRRNESSGATILSFSFTQTEDKDGVII